ncbi:DHH family phosphoesterase [Pseudoruminococcus massiliensis]|uniref:DHH family phosphoesterase n=1 Tax=Pseudoruminococcus massiliensis TaxID=2086583 RepID=UPI000D101D82|nr:DHH family phosphoesterase [Pseudoruminococcus massiliensis]
MITLESAAKMLLSKDKILILTHRSPDGDTIGSGYALAMALRKLGKNVKVDCTDPFPEKYSYFTDKLEKLEFDEEFVVSVDIADTKLLGEKLSDYADKIDLCIDHHGSNTKYAKEYYVEASAAAAAQVIAKLIRLMNVEFDKDIANAIYTGITTDTGCFRYTNVTAETHRIAADMIDCGAESGMINRLMFETKSRSRLEIERRVMDSIQFYLDGRCAIAYATIDMMKESGAVDNDMEGVSSLPRQIEGVMAGITLREKNNGKFKVSVRTTDELDASAICANFGGGGHKAAAGCMITGTLNEAIEQIIEVVRQALEGK